MNLEFPFNSLSFGQISCNITYELYKRGIQPNIFPISQPDLSAFDKLPDEFKNWLAAGMNGAVKKFKKDYQYLKLWHISQSCHHLSEPSALLTFYELDSPTDLEVNILNQFSKIFVTSTCSKTIFCDYGVKTPIVYVPLGFDNLHFAHIENPRKLDGVVSFILVGKAEKRKHTEQVIRAWCRKFGGDHKYRLHLHVTNPFFQPDQMNAFYARVFDNNRPPFNITIFNFVQKNSEFNGYLNAADIVLDLSGGESLSLPSLTAVAIGKHAVVHNCSAFKDWAKEENAVLVNPSGKEPAYDGVFFHPNSGYNAGNIYTFNDDDFITGCEAAIKRFEKNPINEAGFKLQETHSYKKGVDIILENLKD